MLGPTDARLYDFHALNGMTTTQLGQIVRANRGDRTLLEMVHSVLAPRSRTNSLRLRTEVEGLLGQQGISDPPSKPWYLRPAYYVIGAIGTLAVGIGHGAGAEIWKLLWLLVHLLPF